MDHEVGPFPWSNFMFQLPWSNLRNNDFTKPLGPSLNQMWTKRNDHVPRNTCANFFNTCPKKANLEKKIKFDHSLVFLCLHLLYLK